MFLGMQDFDFDQILPKFAQILSIYMYQNIWYLFKILGKFLQTLPNLLKYYPNLSKFYPHFSKFCTKNITRRYGRIPSSYGIGSAFSSSALLRLFFTSNSIVFMGAQKCI